MAWGQAAISTSTLAARQPGVPPSAAPPGAAPAGSPESKDAESPKSPRMRLLLRSTDRATTLRPTRLPIRIAKQPSLAPIRKDSGRGPAEYARTGSPAIRHALFHRADDGPKGTQNGFGSGTKVRERTADWWPVA